MSWEEIGSDYLELNDFSGGLNTLGIISKMSDNETSSSRNWVYYRNALRRLPGSSKYLNYKVNSTATITGITQFNMANGNSYLVATSGDKIKYSNGTDWVDITGAVTITPGYKFSFTVFNNTLIATNGVDAPIKWAGPAGNAAALGGNPPKGYYVISFRGYVLLANCDDGGTRYPMRVYYSALNDHETWDLVTGYWNFENEIGSPITGIKQFGARVIIYHKDTISTASGLPGTSSSAIFPNQIPGIGCVDGRTIVAAMYPFGIEGVVNYVYGHVFRSYEGYYLFDGATPREIGIKLINENGSLNLNYLTNSCASYNPETRQLYSFLPYGTSTTNNYGYVLDAVNGGWWPTFGHDAQYTTTIKENNRYKILYGGSDGYIRYINSSVYEIDSTPMENYWYSKWFDITKPSELKMMKDLLFSVSIVGNFYLHVQLEFDLPFSARKQVGTVDLSSTVGSVYGTGTYGTATYGGSGFDIRPATVGGESFYHVRLKLWVTDPIECPIEKIGMHVAKFGDRRKE